MKIAIVVPGGVDRGGRERVIPALLAFIGRVAAVHETHVFAVAQEPEPGQWPLRGSLVHNAGRPASTARTVSAIVREHGRGAFDVVHAFWVVPPGLAGALAARAIRRPLLLHVAGGELVALRTIRYGGSRTWRGRTLLRYAMRSAQRITAASMPMLHAIREAGFPAERVPLGVALDEWAPLPPRPRDHDRPTRLVHVASLNAVKDQPTLIAAAARLADAGVHFTLDVVGADTTGGAVAALAQRLGLADRIRFHGFQPYGRVHQIVAGADLFVLSSLHDAGPVAVLEAAAAGVPTVGTRVGHLVEWSPVAAVAVPRGDPAALAESAAALIADDARRLAVAREAHRLALAEDADHTARAFLALYESAARKPTPARIAL